MAFLAGCWSLDFQEPGKVKNTKKLPTEETFQRGFSSTWDAVKQVMAKFPILEHKIDSKSDRAYLVTDWIRGKSDTLFRGYLEEVRVPLVVRYKLYIYVVGDNMGQRTRVSIRNIEEYLTDSITSELDFNRSLYQWVRTESSTKKENQILKELSNALNAGTSPNASRR